MRILSRKPRAAEKTSRKEERGHPVHRRIEITVEREIVSVLVRGPQPDVTEKPVLEMDCPTPIPSDLPKPT